MKRLCLSLSVFLTLVVCLSAVSVVAQAQTRDKYLISAKAGGINLVTGNVTVVREGATDQQTVTDQDNLERGDVVTTGAGGRVEVLLNPGSYLRVAENSEFELADTSLDRLRMKVSRGSAIIEAVGADGAEVQLYVETPQTSITIVKRGIYRINVLPNGLTELLVLKGRALVGATAQVVKGNKKIVVGGGAVAQVTKLDKKDRDSFDLWSRERAEYLASLNRTIPSYVINQSFQSLNYDWDLDFGNRRSGGIWFRAGNCFVFVPVYSGIWSSPYGYRYPSGYRVCCGNGRQPDDPPPSGGGGNGGGGNSSPSSPSSPGSPAPSRPEPSRPSPAPSQPAPVFQAPPSPSMREAPARIESPRTRENPNR